MKKPLLVFLAVLMIAAPAFAAAPAMERLPLTSAILMEASTGTVLYEQNADVRLPPASVTKIMTLLLVMEAVENGRIGLEDKISCSAAAAAMGGSQIYFEVGEVFTVNELIKSVSIASANDAAVQLAEAVAGSEASFVSMMNDRARSLGMVDTTFKNCTGLDVEGHETTARDIAVMSRELMQHELITHYSTIWMDSIRNGAFGLTNTNRLMRTYKGANGLKTGFTSKAMYCLSATAERDGMGMIAVVLGASNSNVRFESAARLLDYGFANYALSEVLPEYEFYSVPVKKGLVDEVRAVVGEEIKPVLLERGAGKSIERSVELAESVEAPVAAGQELGDFIITVDGKEYARYPLTADDDVGKLGLGNMIKRLIKIGFCGASVFYELN